MINDIINIFALNLKKINVSEETQKYIDEKFNTIKIKNATQKIIKIINSLFRFEFIETETDNNKHTNYILSDIATELKDINDKLNIQHTLEQELNEVFN